ncbi:hypothetical protein BMS3Abin17_00639 [archaeon BMS3Abin17]|nr:hypothetical protein BMS3Abin17_00639 [archaeon BMS3Abin17]HDZ60670.1 hypothetical protein [Candidatus Pacearchaeota archaeon]
MRDKKAAMEMSVGTIVTIVLLMTVLILGLVLVRTIFSGAVDNIDSIDESIKGEIQKLFAEDTSKKIIIYPSSRIVKIKKGSGNSGFAISIRNVDDEQDSFGYSIKAEEADCNLRLSEADDFIALGRERSGIEIAAGSIMEDPIFVRFDIPDTAPPCGIRYSIEVDKHGNLYGSSIDVDLFIESE